MSPRNDASGAGHDAPSSDPGLERRPVIVDATRLLLVIHRFAVEPDDSMRRLRCWPPHPVRRVLTPEYLLQKVDFLVRYPSYVAYELIELHRLDVPSAMDGEAVKRDVRAVFALREPELRTQPFRRFWRGAYERLDRVLNWWHARGLVFTGQERQPAPGGMGRPQRYFFLSPDGETAAQQVVEHVDHARWYDERIRLIHRYFGGLPAARIKSLQYAHPQYADAQLNEYIPDINAADVEEQFQAVFGEPLTPLAHG